MPSKSQRQSRKSRKQRRSRRQNQRGGTTIKKEEPVVPGPGPEEEVPVLQLDDAGGNGGGRAPRGEPIPENIADANQVKTQDQKGGKKINMKQNQKGGDSAPEVAAAAVATGTAIAASDAEATEPVVAESDAVSGADVDEPVAVAGATGGRKQRRNSSKKGKKSKKSKKSRR